MSDIDIVDALRQTMSEISHLGADEIDRLRADLAEKTIEVAALSRTLSGVNTEHLGLEAEHCADNARLTRERDEARAAHEEACARAAEFELAWAALRAAAWPGEGHWTREPAEEEGEYLHRSWDDETPRIFRLLDGMRPCEFSDRLHDPAYRWSRPLPAMPPVEEEPQ